MMRHDTAVLIVGGGPVGLALAGELGWRVVPCWRARTATSHGVATTNPMTLPR